MKLQKIKYKIATVGFSLEVEGYAIESDLPVRLCVRRKSGFWCTDHYDTGYSIGVLHSTRQQAVAHCIEEVSRKLKSGEFAKAIRAYNRNPGSAIRVVPT